MASSATDRNEMTGEVAEMEEAEEQDRLDVEVALLAAMATRDVGTGTPTEAVDLGALSATEKRALVAMIRSRLEIGEADVSDNDPQGDTFAHPTATAAPAGTPEA